MGEASSRQMVNDSVSRGCGNATNQIHTAFTLAFSGSWVTTIWRLGKHPPWQVRASLVHPRSSLLRES